MFNDESLCCFKHFFPSNLVQVWTFVTVFPKNLQNVEYSKKRLFTVPCWAANMLFNIYPKSDFQGAQCLKDKLQLITRVYHFWLSTFPLNNNNNTTTTNPLRTSSLHLGSQCWFFIHSNHSDVLLMKYFSSDIQTKCWSICSKTPT